LINTSVQIKKKEGFKCRECGKNVSEMNMTTQLCIECDKKRKEVRRMEEEKVETKKEVEELIEKKEEKLVEEVKEETKEE